MEDRSSIPAHHSIMRTKTRGFLEFMAAVLLGLVVYLVLCFSALWAYQRLADCPAPAVVCFRGRP